MTFQDQEKLLELVFSLVVSMNAKTLKLNIVHVQNVLWSKGPTCMIYRPGKLFEKWPRAKIYLLKYATIKSSNIHTAKKSKMARIEMYNLKTRLVQFKDQRKAKNILNS